MNFKKINDEVLYTTDQRTVVDAPFVAFMKEQADQNPRQRIRLCLHADPEDLIHEMLIIHKAECYVRPHKHLTRMESFMILEGTVDVILFDEEGHVTDCVEMGTYSSGKPFLQRLSTPVYHSLIIHSDYLIFHETTSGPFDATDTAFPSWAPEDADVEKVEHYMESLRNKVQLLKQ